MLLSINSVHQLLRKYEPDSGHIHPFGIENSDISSLRWLLRKWEVRLYNETAPKGSVADRALLKTSETIELAYLILQSKSKNSSVPGKLLEELAGALHMPAGVTEDPSSVIKAKLSKASTMTVECALILFKNNIPLLSKKGQLTHAR